MEKEEFIKILEKIKGDVAKIETNTHINENKRNLLVGFCEGVIEGLQLQKENKK